MMRAIDVAIQTPAGDVIARLGPSEYGVKSVEHRRGYLYIHLSKDGEAQVPANAKGVRYFLPGNLPVDVESVQVPADGGPTVITLGAGKASSLVTFRMTLEAANLVRAALDAFRHNGEAVAEIGADADALGKAAVVFPVGAVKL